MREQTLWLFQIKKLLDGAGSSQLWNDGMGPKDGKTCLLRIIRVRLKEHEIQK